MPSGCGAVPVPLSAALSTATAMAVDRSSAKFEILYWNSILIVLGFVLRSLDRRGEVSKAA
jgi:hypothetical protein